MAGYQTIEAVRPRLHRGPAPTPIVDRALVRPEPVFAPRRGRAIPAEMSRQIVRRREAGESSHAIAEIFGISHMTVLRHTKHVPQPPGGWPDAWSNGRRTRMPFRMEFAQRLRRSGFSYAEIAAECGCDRATVYRNLTGRDGPRGRLLLSEMTRRVVVVAGVRSRLLRADGKGAGGRRCEHISRVRAILFWLARNRMRLSYPEIARRFGGFDHTSVMHGVRRVAKTLANNRISGDLSVGRLTRALLKAEWLDGRQ